MHFMNHLNYNCSDGEYKRKLKEHISMNDISHLYGSSRLLIPLLFVNILISRTVF